MPDEYRPLDVDELIRLDDSDHVQEDLRPWGRVNPHAYAFETFEEPRFERTEIDGIYAIGGRVIPGVPLTDEEQSVGTVYPRELELRVKARALRDERHSRFVRPPTPLNGLRPGGTPVAYLPRVAYATQVRAAFGVSARGGAVDLSTVVVKTTDGDLHTTVIDGESREYLRPEFFPYTAVCKLELWLPDASGVWSAASAYASGFLVGRRILMTSGHSFDNAPAGARIRVIPACWANQPVFGHGYFTWVQRRRRWHSDSGNDLQICQLTDPVGDDMGYFGIRTYDSDWEGKRRWTMAGFPYDRSKWGMSVQYGIAVRDDDDGDDISLDGERYDSTQVENDADEASGASGSPLFGWFGKDNPCAIGVHSGSQTDGTLYGPETWSCAAGGDALHAIVEWGRANWD